MLHCIGKDKRYPLRAIFFQYRLCGLLLQIHPVKILPDCGLHRFFTVQIQLSRFQTVICPAMLHCIFNRMHIKRRIRLFFQSLLRFPFYQLFPLTDKVRQFHISMYIYKTCGHFPSTVHDDHVAFTGIIPLISFRKGRSDFVTNRIHTVRQRWYASIDERIILPVYLKTILFYIIPVGKDVLPTFCLFINLKNSVSVSRIRI